MYQGEGAEPPAVPAGGRAEEGRDHLSAPTSPDPPPPHPLVHTLSLARLLGSEKGSVIEPKLMPVKTLRS